jgi:hypothetical protein
MMDYQCARCGGSVDSVDCWNCGGEGYFDEHDMDPINFGPGEEFESCHVCHGTGGWLECINTPAWCEANPVKGRESVERGKVESFEVAS